MKKALLLSLAASIALAWGCAKKDLVAPYTAPVASNISISSLNHTKDTVSVGDTIYLNVAGSIYDTLNVYAYLTVSSSVSGTPLLNYGSVSAPIKLATALGSANVNGTNTFTATIRLVGATAVHKSKLSVTGNFLYQLSLSSEGNGTATASDAGIINKTIYVQ